MGPATCQLSPLSACPSVCVDPEVAGPHTAREEARREERTETREEDGKIKTREEQNYNNNNEPFLYNTFKTQ